MADPFSTAASAIALVGAAYKTGKEIYNLASGIKNAPQSIDRISTETRSLCATLQSLQSVLPDGSALEDTASPLHSLIANLDGVLQNCVDLLAQVERKLEQFLAADGRAVKSAWRGLRWQAFEKASVDRLQKDINTYKLTLVIACHSLSMYVLLTASPYVLEHLHLSRAQNLNTGSVMLERMSLLQRDVAQVRQCIHRLDQDEATLVPPDFPRERRSSMESSSSLCLKRFLDDTESMWSGEISRNPSMAVSSLDEELALRAEVLEQSKIETNPEKDSELAETNKSPDAFSEPPPDYTAEPPATMLADLGNRDQIRSLPYAIGFNRKLRQYAKGETVGLKAPSFVEDIMSTVPSNAGDRPLIVSSPWNPEVAQSIISVLLTAWPRIQFVVQKKRYAMNELILQYQPIKATIRTNNASEDPCSSNTLSRCQECRKEPRSKTDTDYRPTIGLSYNQAPPSSVSSDEWCLWHEECFKCAACSGRVEYSLGVWTDVENNTIYCFQCFHECHRCSRHLGSMALLVQSKLSVCSRCSLLVEPLSEDEKSFQWSSSVITRVGFANRKEAHYVPMNRDQATGKKNILPLAF
ncbi:MAG: hypothetical protein M1828_000210 [Chrysothrix sp. TS-e1954]|nr:MAG: hypothetical protein M1828_000210 [Chrysothrix sp. TS-e1954]